MLNDLPPVCVCVCVLTCMTSPLHVCILYAVGIRTAYVYACMYICTAYACTYLCHNCLGRVPLDLSTVPRTSSPSHAVLPIHPSISPRQCPFPFHVCLKRKWTLGMRLQTLHHQAALYWVCGGEGLVG